MFVTDTHRQDALRPRTPASLPGCTQCAMQRNQRTTAKPSSKPFGHPGLLRPEEGPTEVQLGLLGVVGQRFQIS